MGSYVLVVDDDPSIRSLLTEVLELADYPVKAAANGAEALRAIESCRPSAMLLDMQMPILDGWGVVRSLQRQGQHVPTVVMTAAAEPHRLCRDLAAEACLGKPFDLEEMLRAVARIRD